MFSEPLHSQSELLDQDDKIDNLGEQSGSGISKNSDEEFISKVADLVGKKLTPLLNARPVQTTWSNFNTSLPTTAIVTSDDTSPPLHFNNSITKNDQNDIFGNIYFY